MSLASTTLGMNLTTTTSLKYNDASVLPHCRWIRWIQERQVVKALVFGSVQYRFRLHSFVIHGLFIPVDTLRFNILPWDECTDKEGNRIKHAHMGGTSKVSPPEPRALHRNTPHPGHYCAVGVGGILENTTQFYSTHGHRVGFANSSPSNKPQSQPSLRMGRGGIVVTDIIKI
jgi:hypothetical protein